MTYRVITEPRALADAEQAHAWIAWESPARALKWLDGLQGAIASLDQFPGRCALAPESSALDYEVRHLLYGSRRSAYRILFTIREDVVYVLRIRHSAQTPLTPGELDAGESLP